MVYVTVQTLLIKLERIMLIDQDGMGMKSSSLRHLYYWGQLSVVPLVEVYLMKMSH